MAENRKDLEGSNKKKSKRRVLGIDGNHLWYLGGITSENFQVTGLRKEILGLLLEGSFLQGKKKRLVANIAARRKAEVFSLNNFLFPLNSLAEVFSPLNRQLRKICWGASWLLLDGCCHITQLTKSHTTILQMTGPKKRLTNEQQVTDAAEEPHVMLNKCEQEDKTLNQSVSCLPTLSGKKIKFTGEF